MKEMWIAVKVLAAVAAAYTIGALMLGGCAAESAPEMPEVTVVAQEQDLTITCNARNTTVAFAARFWGTNTGNIQWSDDGYWQVGLPRNGLPERGRVRPLQSVRGTLTSEIHLIGSGGYYFYSYVKCGCDINTCVLF